MNLRVIYKAEFDTDLGLLNYLHPFDGRRASKVHARIADIPGLSFEAPTHSVNAQVLERFQTPLLQRSLKSKRYVLRALELPYLPLIPFRVVDDRVLSPMRWAVAGTIVAAQSALGGTTAYSLFGGYHHATRSASERFCLYNDVGIAYTHLLEAERIRREDRVLLNRFCSQ